MKTEVLETIAKARGILEGKGECCPAYVGFEKETYTLTKEEVHTISKALYLADTELYEPEQ
jgi:hypothetical protein